MTEMLARRRIKPPTHWRGTAYHEAGHVIAAVHKGVRFHSVELQLIGGQVLLLDEVPIITRMTSAVFRLAGPVAQAKATRRKLDTCLQEQMSEDFHDTKYARNLLNNNEVKYESALNEAKNIIAENWWEVELIATTLLKTTKLSEEQVLQHLNN